MTEATILTNQILLEIPKRYPGARAWRRNVGVGVGLDTVRQAKSLAIKGLVNEALQLLGSRPVRFGMPGEGDIDGLVPINGYAVRLSIEVKIGRDRMSPEQAAFREMILGAGGLAVEAREFAAAMAELDRQIAIKKGREGVVVWGAAYKVIEGKK